MGRQDKYQEGHWYVTNSISVWSRGNISSFPVMKLLQEHDEETNHMQRRINQIIELRELREKAYDRANMHQEKMKKTFDMKVKEEPFQINDLILKWDA